VTVGLTLDTILLGQYARAVQLEPLAKKYTFKYRKKRLVLSIGLSWTGTVKEEAGLKNHLHSIK
jgi:hypothetical protein